MPLKPLPPSQFPIVGVSPTTLPYAEWFASVDQLLRSAPGFAGSVASDSNAAGHALAVANLLAGVLVRSGPAGAFGDTTPTATEIVKAIPKAVIGTSRLIIVGNSGGGTMTLSGGTGVTMVFGTTVDAGFWRWFLITVTGITPGAETVSIHGLMTAAG